jgi:hypothetical protein
VRDGRGGRMLLRMSDQLVHIAIDVSITGEQIRGHVCDGVQAPRTFSGWLGLIGELDGMLGSQRQDRATPTADKAAGIQGFVRHEQKASPPRAGAPERRE